MTPVPWSPASLPRAGVPVSVVIVAVLITAGGAVAAAAVYFELAPGGYSSLEKHTHVHTIIVLRGQGRAVVGHQVFDLAPFDLLHVPPDTPHRWVNESAEPFGFLCPVDAQRDPPQPVDDAEWDALQRIPTTAPYVF